MLSTVYPPEDPRNAALLAFFTKHEINFLGGGNSLNYLITAEDGSVFVLKLEHHVQLPKTMVTYLRQHGLREVLTPVYVDRQGVFLDPTVDPILNPDTLDSRALVITDYYPQGDLEAHSSHQPNDTERLKSALNIYAQMSKILIDIQNDGACFPDMKNTNWLIDDDSKLRIADGKSFVPISANEAFRRTGPESKWYGLLTSVQLEPPEVSENADPISVDPMHLYMLGRSLYQYLTTCEATYFFDPDSSSTDETPGPSTDGTYDFSAPIFHTTSTGRELKSMIEQMLITDPIIRAQTKLTDVHTKLCQLNNQPLQAMPPVIIPPNLDPYKHKIQMLKIQEEAAEESKMTYNPMHK